MEYFGISLKTGGLKKGLQVGETNFSAEKQNHNEQKEKPDTVQQYRTVQSYLVASYDRLSCFIIILKTRIFPDQTFH